MIRRSVVCNPDIKFISELQQVSFQPIFILGLHRSGTSILYKMLVATGNFNPVTVYHLIKYNELLLNHHLKKEEQSKLHLTKLFKEKGLQDRGIDRLKITADFAEEYGFLLNKQTLQMSLSRKNLALFMEMCKKIQFIAGNKKPILLKNPYDFPNFIYIKRVFPNARFVFIHRDPLKTISSTLRAIKLILKNKNSYTSLLSKIYDAFYMNPLILFSLRFIFSIIPEFGVIIITRINKKATNYYLKNIQRLPKEIYISITYEDLCQYPMETLEHIMRRLNLDMINKTDPSILMKPRRVEVDDSVKKFQKHIFKSMKKYCDKFHYTTEI